MQNWTLHHCHGNLLPLWVHQRLSDNLMSLARALSRSGDQLESVAGLVFGITSTNGSGLFSDVDGTSGCGSLGLVSISGHGSLDWSSCGLNATAFM